MRIRRSLNSRPPPTHSVRPEERLQKLPLLRDCFCEAQVRLGVFTVHPLELVPGSDLRAFAFADHSRRVKAAVARPLMDRERRRVREDAIALAASATILRS